MKVVLTGTACQFLRQIELVLACSLRTAAPRSRSIAVLRLAQLGVRPVELDALLMTHFHSDHMTDLPDLAITHWIQSMGTILSGGAHRPLLVFGAAGVDSLTHRAEQFIAPDVDRRAHFRSLPRPSSLLTAMPFVASRDEPELVSVATVGSIRVEALAVNHGHVAEAVGYRLTSTLTGSVVAISGDTTECDAVVRLSQNADVLVHEVFDAQQWAEVYGKPFQGLIEYHSQPHQVGRMAAKAGVKQLLITHVAPDLNTEERRARTRDAIAAEFGGPITIGHDLSTTTC